MGTRAHRERRRRVGRKTWGPAKRRAVRRYAKSLVWHTKRLKASRPVVSPSVAALIAEVEAFGAAFVRAAQSATDASGDMVVFFVGYLGEVHPPHGHVDESGEWWPDAHQMTFTDEPVAGSRERLDDWLARSEAVLDQTDEPRSMFYIPGVPQTLDIGIVRDPTLAVNDFHIFPEEMTPMRSDDDEVWENDEDGWRIG